MKTDPKDFYIRKNFIFYDSCVAPLIGLPEIYLSDILRRFIWRGKARNPFIASLAKGDLVFATISQKTLMGALGLSRRQTVTEYMATLVQLGWVEVQRQRATETSAYVLGRKVKDDEGKLHEVLFVDTWCRELWACLEDASRKEWGVVTSRNKTRPASESLACPVTATSSAWRADQVRAFMGRSSDHVVAGQVQSSVPGRYAGEYLRSREEKIEKSDTEKREPDDSLRSRLPLENQRVPSENEGRGEREESERRSLGWGLKAPRKEEVPRRVGSMSHLDAPSKFKKPGDGAPPQAALGSRRSFQRSRAGSLPVEVPKAPESVVTAVGAPVEDDKEPEGWEVPVAPEEAVPEVVERLSMLERIAKEAKRRGIEARTEAQLKDRRLAQKKANLAGASVPLTQKGLFAEIEKMWLERMRERFPGVTIASWGGKERGQVKQLIEKYGGVVAKLALDYVVSRWDDIRARFLKGKGGVPSIGFLLRFHDTLVVEAQRRGEWLRVKEEWERWQVQHPSDPYPPVDLEARYQRCKRDVDGLGLPT